MNTCSATRAAEVLVRDGIDLFLHGWDEIEVDGKYGAGGEECHENAEGIRFAAV